MDATGERYLPTMTSPFISYEHWHRYMFAAKFVHGKDVLDIASGEGYGSHYLSSYARTVIGVDIDPEAVGHACQTYIAPNLTYIVGSAANVPIEGQHRFDTIVSYETLEHLDSASQLQFLGHVTRLLRPNGVLLISTPNKSLYNFRNQAPNPFHLHEHDKAEFVSLLNVWFSNVRVYAQRVYPASLICQLDTRVINLSLDQIGILNGKFSPVPRSFLQDLYLIAVCSNAPLRADVDSVMIDVNDAAFNIDTSHDSESLLSTLYYDTGSGLGENCTIKIPIDAIASHHCIVYTIPPGSIRLRWDPIEGCLATIFSLRITWMLTDGSSVLIDPARLENNGHWAKDDELQFATLDPMIWFDKIPDHVSEIEFRFRLQSLSRTESLVQLDKLAMSAQTKLPLLEHKVHCLTQTIRTLSEEIRWLRSNYERVLSTSLYVDTGSGYIDSSRIALTVRDTSAQFSFQFDTSRYSVIHAVRWVPIESRSCWVSLVKAYALYTDTDGQSCVVNLVPGIMAGLHEDSGGVLIGPFDPGMIFHIPQAAQCVVVEGKWIIDSLQATLDRLALQRGVTQC